MLRLIHGDTQMFRALGTLLDGLAWGFSMAIGWILAFSLAGLVAA